MNTAGKLSAYGAALVLVAAGAWAIGTAVGPVAGEAGVHGMEEATHGDDHSGTVAEIQPAGLASSRGGYTLTPTSTTLATGTTTEFAFRITGPDGTPVTAFDVEHDKRMHLIVVRRDTAGFRHVHPAMTADGTWTVPLDAAKRAATAPSPTSNPPGARPRRSASTWPRQATSSRGPTRPRASRSWTDTACASTATSRRAGRRR
ncbi:hypothetical protein GCM10023214_37610 [Amycolatopsis dongchuanensis]|uniref:Secreted protein n=1 Tax=Amycolatopsis dongchuanensis TaxID=1070866 RepID=A0ABP9QR22_9PSEU